MGRSWKEFVRHHGDIRHFKLQLLLLISSRIILLCEMFLFQDVCGQTLGLFGKLTNLAQVKGVTKFLYQVILNRTEWKMEDILFEKRAISVGFPWRLSFGHNGRLILTSKFLLFNWGSKRAGRSARFNLDEVAAVMKYGLNGFAIRLKDGSVERFRLWGRSKLIEAVKNVKGEISTTSLPLPPITRILSVIGVLLSIISLFDPWMKALPTPFISVPIAPLEQLSISLSSWGLFGLLGSNFFFECCILIIFFCLVSVVTSDIDLMTSSGLAGIAVFIIIIMLIQSDSFSIERPAPWGSIEYLRFQPEIGLFAYLIASVIVFASGIIAVQTIKHLK